MLTAAGYDTAKILADCQSAAGEVVGKEGDTKRGDMRGVSKGSEIAWKENTAVDFLAKSNPPLEMVKWADGLAAFFKKNGNPRADLSPGILPEGLVFWLEAKQRIDRPKNEKNVAKNGNKGNGRQNGGVNPLPAPEVPTAEAAK